MNPADIASWISDAQKAFAAAPDLDSLKVARLAHTGAQIQSLTSKSKQAKSLERVTLQQQVASMTNNSST